jgi:AcrR family transcriptional regulator
MRKQRGPYRGTGARQREILEAALACFSEVGYLETTMEDIRRRSGASQGSIYHHFGGKEQLAAAVYVQGIRDYQAGLTDELALHPGSREGIHALIAHHLRWARDHADYARYLVRMRHAEFMGLAEAEIAKENQVFIGALASFFQRQVREGNLRRLPRELYVPLLLGPAQELAHHWLLNGKEVEVELAISELADAAWRALRPEHDGTSKQATRGSGRRSLATREKSHGRK